MNYIYLDREKAKLGIALVYFASESAVGNYEEYFEGKAIEFIGDNLPHYITYVEDMDSVREATEIEIIERGQRVLADNEVIIDNEIVVYNAESQKVIDGEILDKTLSDYIEEGTITLDKYKEKLKEKVTAYRDSLRETSTVEYNGHNQRYRKDDLSDIDYYQGRLEKAQKTAQETENSLALEEERDAEEIILTMTWYFYDGTTAEVSIEDFNNIVALTDEPVSELYRKENVLRTQIESLESVEELENFDIESEWEQA